MPEALRNRISKARKLQENKNPYVTSVEKVAGRKIATSEECRKPSEREPNEKVVEKKPHLQFPTVSEIFSSSKQQQSPEPPKLEHHKRQYA